MLFQNYLLRNFYFAGEIVSSDVFLIKKSFITAVKMRLFANKACLSLQYSGGNYVNNFINKD